MMMKHKTSSKKKQKESDIYVQTYSDEVSNSESVSEMGSLLDVKMVGLKSIEEGDSKLEQSLSPPKPQIKFLKARTEELKVVEFLETDSKELATEKAKLLQRQFPSKKESLLQVPGQNTPLMMKNRKSVMPQPIAKLMKTSNGENENKQGTPRRHPISMDRVRVKSADSDKLGMSKLNLESIQEAGGGRSSTFRKNRMTPAQRTQYEKFKKLRKEVGSMQVSIKAIKYALMRMITRVKKPQMGIENWNHQCAEEEDLQRKQEEMERMTHCSINTAEEGKTEKRQLLKSLTTGLQSGPFEVEEDFKSVYDMFMKINAYETNSPVYAFTHEGLVPITIKVVANHDFWRLESATDESDFNEVLSIVAIFKENGILYQRKASSRAEKMWGWSHPELQFEGPPQPPQGQLVRADASSLTGSVASRRETLAIRHENKSLFKNRIVLLKYKEFERYFYFESEKQKKQWMAGLRATLRALIKERPEMANQLPIYTPFRSEQGASAANFKYEKFDPLKELYASQAKIIKEMNKISDYRAAIDGEQLIVHFNKKNVEKSQMYHIMLRFDKSQQLFLEMREELSKLSLISQNAELKLLEIAMYERAYTVWVKPKELESIRFKMEEWLFYKNPRSFYERHQQTSRLQLKLDQSNFFYSARFLGLNLVHKESTPTHSHFSKTKMAKQSSIKLKSKNMRQIRTAGWDPNYEAKTKLEEDIDNFLKTLQTNLMNRTSVTNANPLFVTVDRLMLQHITLQHRFTMMRKFRRPNKRRALRHKLFTTHHMPVRSTTPLSEMLVHTQRSHSNTNMNQTPRSSMNLRPDYNPSNRELNKTSFHFSSRSLEGPMKYLARSLAQQGQKSKQTKNTFAKYSTFKHDASKEDLPQRDALDDSQIHSSFNESVFRRVNQQRPSEFVQAKRNRENYCNAKPCAIF